MRVTVEIAIAIGILVVALVVAAYAIWRVIRRWTRSIDQIQNSIVALELGRSVRSSEVGPLDRLAKTLNVVAPRLETKVSDLERELQQHRAVLEGMAEGVLAFDSRQRVLFANPAAARLFGLKENPFGQLIAEVIRAPRIQGAVEAALTGMDRYRDELTILGPEGGPLGQEFILDVQGAILPGSTPPGAVLVFHDVTDLRRLETMRQDFVTNASHELKTPVSAIKAYAETLLDGALRDDAVNVKFLQGIADQADRLDLLIRDLLSLQKLESGQEVFRHAPMHLAPAFHRIAEAQRPRAEAKGLDFVAQVAPDAEAATVIVDEEAVRQILDNLIDNAIKYTPEHGHVRSSLRLSGTSEVVLEVADTGIGIPREELQRVFERFYRVDKARSRDLGGTGLGLSIVKHLVQSLSGRISLISRPGSGSTFSVFLPRTRASSPVIRSHAEIGSDRALIDGSAEPDDEVQR